MDTTGSRMKRCVIVSVCFATIAAAPALAQAQNLDTELGWWMRYVDDATNIAALTIPGTHDSGALYEPIGGTAACQSLSIGDQLAIGVRYLDVRLRQYGNSLLVHHGAIYQHANFDDVLQRTIAFLQANPSEAVLMEVSREYDAANSTETFEQTFLRYASNPTYASFWWRGSYVPQLGEVRGKIVLLRRFGGGTAGGIDVTNWRDNGEFTVGDARGTSIVVQDYYKVNAGTNAHKWSAIVDLLERAASDTDATLYLNFTSGVRSILGVPDIPGVANQIDANLYDYFGADTRHQVHYGVVISDFVNRPLIQRELARYFY